MAQVIRCLEPAPEESGLPFLHLIDERGLTRVAINAFLDKGEDVFSAFRFLVFLVRRRHARRLKRAVFRTQDQHDNICLAQFAEASNLRRIWPGSEILGHDRFMAQRRDCIPRRCAQRFHAGNE